MIYFEGKDGKRKELSEMTDDEKYFMKQKLSQPIDLSEENQLITISECYNPKIDDWVPGMGGEEIFFRDLDKAMVVPAVSMMCNEPSGTLGWFILSPKRCYNRPDTRSHISKYLNYFETFYDKDHELISIYCHIKCLLDYMPEYNKQLFISDLKRYIIYNPSINAKLDRMNNDNYMIMLRAKKGKSVPSLQYKTKHGMLLMKMSLLMNMVIPLTTHFIHNKHIESVDDMLMQVFDEILTISDDIDIYSKLYETASTEMKNNAKVHSGVWSQQDIRGIDPVTLATKAIDNIILNIMPKYTYNRNVVSFNFTSIRKSARYKVTDIRYEYQFSSLSSSNRDDDFNSDTDKFEAYLIRASEQLYLQNKVNCEQTLIDLEYKYGTFEDKEIQYYIDRLSETNGNIINWFQKDLIFNLMYKYFGDPVSINSVNKIDYIKLMLIAKKILLSYNMIFLPYIISGMVIYTPNKRNINKKEQIKLEASQYWPKVRERYRNTKIIDIIIEQIAILLASDFKIIEFYDNMLDGKKIACEPDIVIDEFLLYILLT